VLSVVEGQELAAAFTEHRYTVDEVVAGIGEEAHRALGRNSTIPAVRALAGRDDPLATLTRLWPLQQPADRAALDRALPRLVAPLIEAKILAAAGGKVRAEIDIRPYASDDGDFWVVSDLSPNLDTAVAPMRPDLVLGLSAASTTLAQLTIRRPVARALDLGTGCGVQSLHLAQHSAEVVATDLNPRALALARLTTMLNGIDLDLREGSLYAPVTGDRFDLITSNPPYVMSPPTGATRLTYREGGIPADGLVEQVVTAGAEHLTDGGVLQVLGNWAHVRGQDWTDRIAGWLQRTGCDAHVVQREVLDPAAYVEVWLSDAGLAGSKEYPDRYHAWLDYFDQLQIEAVGLGWLMLHRAGRDQPDVRIEDWPYPLEQPMGEFLATEREFVDLERRLSDQQLLDRRWVLAPDVIEETSGRPGATDPEHLMFRQQRGFRRAVALDTATAGILGACDGELTLGQIVDSVAQLLSVEPGNLTGQAIARIRPLIVDGLIQ
jgi:methylase of polypeptide subunit release factors